MLCYRCGGHVKDGSEKCAGCGQAFALGLNPGPIAGFGTGSRRHRVAIEGTPYKSGDAIARRYQVKDHVGAGPVGWVYRAADTEADVDVALKVVSPRFLQTADERKAFLGEMHKAKALSHPNLARVYDFGEDQERPFVATQFLEGLTLRRIMDLRRQKGQGFSLKEVEPIVAQIAAALEAASAAFAHGDLKPDNVIVLPDLLKLTDFGLATSLPRAPFMAAQKAGGVHRYLAPEFLVGERLDTRTDVYGLGVMLAEMLAGAQYEPSLDLCARNPSLPKGVQDIFRRAVAHKPHDRFGTAADLADELSDLLERGDARAHASPSGNTRPNAPRPGAITSPGLPLAAHASLPPPMPQAMPPTLPAVAEGSDEVVIEEIHTDPRIRIARALAQHDEQIRAEARRATPTNHALAAASQIPGTLQTSLLPEPAPIVASGKGADAAEVAARVGATAELLTAETAVRHAPTAPPAAAPAVAVVAEPVLAAPAARAEEKTEIIKAPQAPAAAEPSAEAEQSTAPQAADGKPLPRRGRGKHAGNKRDDRIARRAAAMAAAQAAAAKDPEWALIDPKAAASPAALPTEPATPVVAAAAAKADEPIVFVKIKSTSAAPKAVPSFGNLVEKKSGLTPPMIAVGGLVAVIVLVTTVGLVRSFRSAAPKAEAEQAEPVKPAEAKDAKEQQKAPEGAAAAAAHEAAKEAAPAKAEEEQPAKARAEEPRPSRAALAKERAQRQAAAEERRQDLWEKLRARREARQAGKKEQKAGAEKPEEETAPAEADRRAQQEEAIAKAAAARSDKDAQVTTAVAKQPEAARAVARPAGGIPGAGDDDVMATKADKAEKTDAPRKVAMAVPAVAQVPAASSGKCPAGMQLVPAGRAMIGSDPKDDLRNFGDRSLTAVDVAAVCIDQYEFPNAPGKLPKIAAAFTEAEALCKASNKRLCSEEEWEKSCKGPEGLRFPYGAQFDAEACNTQDKAEAARQVGPAGSFNKCKSGYGVYDLSGNVAEWTTSSFEGGIERAVKGGSASRPGFDDRCASRRKAKPNLHDVKIGFRCCVEPT